MFSWTGRGPCFDTASPRSCYSHSQMATYGRYEREQPNSDLMWAKGFSQHLAAESLSMPMFRQGEVPVRPQLQPSGPSAPGYGQSPISQHPCFWLSGFCGLGPAHFLPIAAQDQFACFGLIWVFNHDTTASEHN